MLIMLNDNRTTQKQPLTGAYRSKSALNQPKKHLLLIIKIIQNTTTNHLKEKHPQTSIYSNSFLSL